MGWKCGQLFEYGQWYWTDTNVASCRVEEATRVCSEIFRVTGTTKYTDSHDIAQSNSGLNLFTVNAFGQSHSISHVGFTMGIIIVVAALILCCVIQKYFKNIKDAVRGPKLRPQQHGPIAAMNTSAPLQGVIALHPAQLRQLAEALSPVVSNRRFEEITEREAGYSRPVRASRLIADRLTPREEADEPIIGLCSQP